MPDKTVQVIKGEKDRVMSIHVRSGLLTGIKERHPVALSFETGEQSSTRIYFPYKVRVDKIRGTVMKIIAATDNGTITASNSTGAMADGVITAVASDAVNTEYSVSPTTNNEIPADSYVQLASSKTTAGGKVLVSMEVTRI